MSDDHGVYVNLESAQARVAELDDDMRRITDDLVRTRAERKRWREVVVRLTKADAMITRAIDIASGKRRAVEHPTLRGDLLAVFEDGADHTAGELGNRFGHISSLLTELERKKLIERVKRGVYRKARATSSLPPRPAYPVRGVTQPSGDAPHRRPPEPANGSEPDLVHLEPLHGAAPQARCPYCPAAAWHSAIGMNHGRYVFRCPATSNAWFNPERVKI